ncbi:MAG: glycosyltransferase family 4 protein [Propionibacteriaceae bacterium]|nr:glycosyltransferase family 4 protein [Propionibacteriaceae bacterium]
MDGNKVVSFAPYAPFPGVTHAGGQQYLKHLNVLATLGYETTVVAPDTAENRAAAAVAGQPFKVHLYSIHPTNPITRLNRVLNSTFTAGRSPWVYGRALRRDREIPKLLEQADFVEAQWSETASLFTDVPVLRDCAQPVVLIIHDVITQREERKSSLVPFWNVPRKIAMMIRSAQAERNEVQALRRAAITVALSGKDETLLRHLVPEAQISQVNPLIGAQARAADLPDAPAALFVGAFARSFNVDAALWMLREIWPRVLKTIPDATLTIAGANPPKELIVAAAAYPSVTVTGFVDTLDDVYETARLVVVPLRGGAGVKFKTVEALVRGIPLVSTPVGAEGLARYISNSFKVVRDAKGFAAAAIELLQADEDALAPSLEQTAIRARHEFGTDHYAHAISHVFSLVQQAA